MTMCYSISLLHAQITDTHIVANYPHSILYSVLSSHHVAEEPTRELQSQPAAENEATPRSTLSSKVTDTASSVQEEPSPEPQSQPENEARSRTLSSQITDTESSVRARASEPGTTKVGGSDSDKARAQTIAKEAAELQHMFVTVVTHTTICFQEKEAAFLGKFRITLKNLPLSNRFEHLYFLDEKKDNIKKAKDVEEILDILDPHWNYREYALLEHIIKEFGTSKLKEEMKEYILKLEKFEKNTSVKDYNSAALDEIQIPDYYEELEITQSKDPTQCSLYDVRQLKYEIVARSTLTGYAVFLKSIRSNSVKIILAFPPGAHTYLSEALDKQFMETHQLQVKATSYSECTHINLTLLSLYQRVGRLSI